MGRPPTPTALKLVRGDKPSRVNHDEPVPSVREVVCPDDLEGDARLLWDKLAPDMIAKGAFTFWDEDEFAAGCVWWALHKRLMRQVQKEGPTVKGGRGNPVKNPNLESAALAFDKADKIFRRYGMTPADRVQLRVTQKGPAHGAERLLS